MSVTVVPILDGRLLRHRVQKLVSRYDKCLNSGGEYLKITLVLFVPINFSNKFGFVSVTGPGEIYFMAALRSIRIMKLGQIIWASQNRQN